MLDKGFIHKSTLLATIPLLLAAKSSSGMQIYYDY
jgi:hypothetical protein